MTEKTAYRPDIDGLRAIAVLGVILYHYGAKWLPGGFTGVDIFFVISGYLITTVIRSELDSGTFSFKRFYLRRILRIFPALIVVLATSLVAGWFLLVPADYSKLAESALYASVGLSNVFFLNNTSYFDQAAELQPLLHTWSLGVEEQFYFVWPLVALGIYRTSPQQRKWVVLALLVVLATFGFSTATANPSVAFYLPLPRAWELLIGAAVTYLPAIRSRPLSVGLLLSGLALVGFSLSFITSSSAFPGVNAAYACIGAALVVWPKEPSFASRLLSSKCLVLLGGMSYSLYLWHWPVIVFFRHTGTAMEPDAVTVALLLGLTFVFSFLTWKYVESLRRIRPAAWTRKTAAVATLFFATIATSCLVFMNGGVPARLSTEAIALAGTALDYNPRRQECHRSDDRTIPLPDSCVFGEAAATPDVVVWSDSHGVELAGALGEFLEKNHRSVELISYSSCPPALDYQSPYQLGCQAHNQRVLEYISSSGTLKTVILVSYISAYLRDDTTSYENGLSSTVEGLISAQKKVVLATPALEPGFSVPQTAARYALTGRAGAVSMTISEHVRAQSEALGLLDRIKSNFPAVSLADLSLGLCSGSVCPLVDGANSVLFDDHHLSNYGAAKAVKALIADNPNLL